MVASGQAVYAPLPALDSILASLLDTDFSPPTKHLRRQSPGVQSKLHSTTLNQHLALPTWSNARSSCCLCVSARVPLTSVPSLLVPYLADPASTIHEADRTTLDLLKSYACQDGHPIDQVCVSSLASS